MYRRFIAAVLACSVGLTVLGSAQARAEVPNRTAQTIAAILGLAVVGAIVHENRKDKRRDEVVRLPTPVQTPPKRSAPVYNLQPKPLPNRAARGLLPERCLRVVDGFSGRARFFGERCLTRHFANAHRLPNACRYSFRTDRGMRLGYEARCLRGRGYRIAGR